MNSILNELYINKLHIGNKKSIKINNSLLIGKNKDNTIINLDKTLLQLNISMNFLKNIIVNQGNILLICKNKYIYNYLYLRLNNIKNVHIYLSWTNGLLTNKELSVIFKKYIPSCIILYNIDLNKSIIKECNKNILPIISLVDSNNKFNQITYPIISNNKSLKCLFFYTNLIISTISKSLDIEINKIYK